LLARSDHNGKGDEVELDMTKTQLAAFLGTIPETISRVFAKMSQDGLIAIDDSRIKLLTRQRLTVLAEG
jgi:CRP/FNR family transcriptional regulator